MDVFIYALEHPELYKPMFAEMNMKEVLYAPHTASITFIDKDLILGTTEHNRLLYVTGDQREGAKVCRI